MSCQCKKSSENEKKLKIKKNHLQNLKFNFGTLDTIKQ